MRGQRPFYKSGETTDKFIKRLNKEKINFEKINISDQGKDLMKRLLDKNQNSRYSAGEALNHPWLTGQSLEERPFTPQE